MHACMHWEGASRERPLLPNQALLELPGDISVTAVDVAAHADVAQLAAGRGELTGLALWLMAERHKVGGPPPLLRHPCHLRSTVRKCWTACWPAQAHTCRSWAALDASR